MGSVCPAFEYLTTCSAAAVESFELSRLNRAANLRKQLRQLIDQCIECEAEARLAQWMRQSRRADFSIADPSLLDPGTAVPKQLALPLLPPSGSLDATCGDSDSACPPVEIRDAHAISRATRGEASPPSSARKTHKRARGQSEVAPHVARPAPVRASQSRHMLRDDLDARRNPATLRQLQSGNRLARKSDAVDFDPLPLNRIDAAGVLHIARAGSSRAHSVRTSTHGRAAARGPLPARRRATDEHTSLYMHEPRVSPASSIAPDYLRCNAALLLA